MFVSNLTLENWVRNKDEGELIDNPNWHQIETAIRELDGKSKTLVTLGTDDEIYMSIRGGQSGQYVVTVTFEHIKFYTLIDLSKSDEIQALVVGGQESEYPAKMCVDLLRCLLAARTFTESGKLDTLLTWQEDTLLMAA